VGRHHQRSLVSPPNSPVCSKGAKGKTIEKQGFSGEGLWRIAVGYNVSLILYLYTTKDFVLLGMVPQGRVDRYSVLVVRKNLGGYKLP